MDKPDPKSTLCFDWLSKLCSASEHQPDIEEIHTIARCKKIEMFEDMIHDLKVDKVEKKKLPSYPLFLQVWRSSYSHLKIPKACRLGRCDECAKMEEELCTSKGQLRDALLQKTARHKLLVFKERAAMRQLQSRAISQPREWTSLSTDWYVIMFHFVPNFFTGVTLT